MSEVHHKSCSLLLFLVVIVDVCFLLDRVL